MKNVLLFLLLVNLLVWGWYSWVDVEPQAEFPATAREIAQQAAEDELLSGSEVQLPDIDPAAGADVPEEGERVALPGQSPIAKDADEQLVEAAAPAIRCVELGPVGDKSRADALQRALTAEQIKVEQETRVENVWLGHWVKVTGFATKTQAAASVERLKAGGLNDLYVMQGDSGWEVSLGIFRKKESADRIVAKAKQAGEPVEMVDRTKQKTAHWLTLEGPVANYQGAENLLNVETTAEVSCD